jgi:hypothetical protein
MMQASDPMACRAELRLIGREAGAMKANSASLKPSLTSARNAGAGSAVSCALAEPMLRVVSTKVTQTIRMHPL